MVRNNQKVDTTSKEVGFVMLLNRTFYDRKSRVQTFRQGLTETEKFSSNVDVNF